MRRRWAWLASGALVAMTAPPMVFVAHADSDEMERVVSLDRLPAPAREAIVREARGSRILRIKEKIKAARTRYEARVATPRGVYEIEVDASGDVLKRELED